MKGSVACTSIVESFLPGTGIIGKDRVIIVDLNPNTSGDWVMAGLTLTRLKQDTPTMPRVGILSICTDKALCTALKLGAEKVFVEDWFFKKAESGSAEPVQNLDGDRRQTQW